MCWRVSAYAQAIISPRVSNHKLAFHLTLAHVVNLYTPLAGHIYPAWWVYIPTALDIYTHQWAWKAESTPPCLRTFLHGMIFFGFSRYRLPAKRLRIKLKRLKAEIAMRYTLLSYTSILNGVIHTISVYERWMQQDLLESLGWNPFCLLGGRNGK